jgi:hypothetical protein
MLLTRALCAFERVIVSFPTLFAFGALERFTHLEYGNVLN